MNQPLEFFLPKAHLEWLSYLQRFEGNAPFGVVFVCPLRINVPVRALPFTDFACHQKSPVSNGCLTSTFFIGGRGSTAYDSGVPDSGV